MKLSDASESIDIDKNKAIGSLDWGDPYPKEIQHIIVPEKGPVDKNDKVKDLKLEEGDWVCIIVGNNISD